MTRKLKVYTHVRMLKWRNNAYYPKVILCGKWLEEAGIKQGEQVRVTVDHSLLHGSRLIIEAVEV